MTFAGLRESSGTQGAASTHNSGQEPGFWLRFRESSRFVHAGSNGAVGRTELSPHFCGREAGCLSQEPRERWSRVPERKRTIATASDNTHRQVNRLRAQYKRTASMHQTDHLGMPQHSWQTWLCPRHGSELPQMRQWGRRPRYECCQLQSDSTMFQD